MKHLRLFVVAVLFLAPPLAGLVPFSADAAPMQKPFEVSGWIPYWRAATGTADVLPHMTTLTEVNPFVYTLKSDGTLLDNGALDSEPWLTLRAEAKKNNVRFIPTIMTSNSELLHTLLSNTKRRIALEDRIAALVKEKGFDGIDIDFEGKYAKTRDYFSTFLKGLYLRMPKHWVMCTIESRTPVADRYWGTTPPADAGVFANDFVAINKYCDRVRIMAYDQQSIDLKLNAQYASSSQLYAPVADPAWVEKTIVLAAKSISKKKLMIGIPTYGYEYDVTAYAGKEYLYDLLWSFNPGYATPIAAQYNVTPYRTPWGEMAFSYSPTATSSLPAPQAGGMNGLATALAATAFADTYNSHLNFRYMVWPDAQSVADKIALAKRLGVRGVSIFKLDGGQDPKVWSVLESTK
ncbi:MAG: glycosyl hydrolase family 18 protein [Patescibacteria group bacterium]